MHIIFISDHQLFRQTLEQFEDQAVKHVPTAIFPIFDARLPCVLL